MDRKTYHALTRLVDELMARQDPAAAKRIRDVLRPFDGAHEHCVDCRAAAGARPA